MAITAFSINGEDGVMALTYEQGGQFDTVKWNPETKKWEPDSVETLPNRYALNLPVSVTMTELKKPNGEYERAYQGIDYMPWVFDGIGTANTKWWQELIVSHSTDIDWINHHSGDLT